MDKLLKLLNENARLTTEQMAVMANMTEAEVAAAIAALEKDGVIRGYKPLIDCCASPPARTRALTASPRPLWPWTRWRVCP